MTAIPRWFPAVCLLFAAAACSRAADQTAQLAPNIRNVLLITIDTLRADRVGAYGYASARTPALDALARTGARFDRAFATAPITLTSHASLLTGRYPPGHGARHNGVPVDPKTPTLAERLAQSGFETAAFVGAFPLDRRFGLDRGFQTYGDKMPRGPDGRPSNERPGRAVADEAIHWLSRHRQNRFFVWVHFFDPHAPYGNPADPAEAARPVSARYDDEIAEADRQAARVVEALGDARSATMIVAAADHGEAFGEHGEVSHSIFTYDTTLRVPLIVSTPGAATPGIVVRDAVSLVDIAATIAALMHVNGFDADGIDLSPALSGSKLSERALYAESFAPLFDFGWSALRTIRSGRWKYIAAPKAELYDVEADPAETQNVRDANIPVASDLARKTDAISSAALPSNLAARDADAVARLQALGYVGGIRGNTTGGDDPKDHRELAAKIAEAMSGELQGPALERALSEILKENSGNAQASVRLGYLLAERGRCADAMPHFARAIQAHLPTADAHLGLAGCQVAARKPEAALSTLRDAEKIDPRNPVVQANIGILLSDMGHSTESLPYFQRALQADPELHQARFTLAVAYARLGRRADAAREASELLKRLPPDAPQRPEVQRLLAAVR